MKVTNVEKKENSTVELTIHVEADEFEAAVQKAYLKSRSRIAVPGFRKGKAPRKIIEGMYGSGVFYEDAINIVYPGAYEEAVKEQGLDDVGYPQTEVVEVGKEGFTFKALVSVRPEVKLGQYKGLTAPKAEPAVTDEDIENELKPYITRATRLVSVDREAQNGDTAVIDFEGFDNGVAFEGGKGENYSLELGSGSFVPGFEEQIVGLKAGDEKELNITFPEDYVPDLAGKAVIFKVKVKEVKEHQAPVVDDEFAKDVSEFETLEEFKKSLGDKLLDSKTKSAQQEYENAVIEQLVGNMEADIPDAMVEVQLDKLMEDFSMRLSNQGMKMEDYLAMMGATPESMRASARPTAQRQVEVDLALTAVADAESITISDEELEEELKKIAEEYKLELDEVKRAIPVEDMKRDLRLRKASELVMAEAKVGEAPKKEEAEEKPKKTTRKKKAESAEGEEAAADLGAALLVPAISEQLAKLYLAAGIQPGSSTVTFDREGGFTAAFGSQKLTGSYEYDAGSHTVSVRPSDEKLEKIGAVSGRAYVSGSELQLLFPVTKLLELAKDVSSQAASLEAASALLANYKNLYIGFSFKK